MMLVSLIVWVMSIVVGVHMIKRLFNVRKRDILIVIIINILLPVGYAEKILSLGLSISSTNHPMVYYILIVGLIEEFSKFLVSKSLGNDMSSLAAIVIAAFGFAVAENLLYFGKPAYVMLSRTIICVPTHIAFSIPMMLATKKKSGWIMDLAGIFEAAVVHGLYDRLTMIVPIGVIILAVTVLVAVLISCSIKNKVELF